MTRHNIQTRQALDDALKHVRAKGYTVTAWGNDRNGYWFDYR